ncbi:hypothetical protein M426DRAFT_21579 [Hypoxylon sp. CI-4A]|nr:hypothetical protein M426DRAFT_21579 [Hypoxylon sp. CI-4A]
MLATRLATTARHGAGAIRRERAMPFDRPMNSHATKLLPHRTAWEFSTSTRKPETKKANNRSPKSEEPPPMNFSFEGLGMSRNTKVAVIVILSIFGTIETIFWIKWIWRWFSGAKDDEDAARKA